LAKSAGNPIHVEFLPKPTGNFARTRLRQMKV